MRENNRHVGVFMKIGDKVYQRHMESRQLLKKGKLDNKVYLMAGGFLTSLDSTFEK